MIDINVEANKLVEENLAATMTNVKLECSNSSSHLGIILALATVYPRERRRYCKVAYLVQLAVDLETHMDFSGSKKPFLLVTMVISSTWTVCHKLCTERTPTPYPL